MIIEISDDITPKERRKNLENLPVIYALNLKNGSVQAAAEFLGISGRCLRDKLKRNEELRKFVRKSSILEKREDEQRRKTVLQRKKQMQIEQMKGQFWFRKLSENEKKEVIERFNSIYE